MFLNLSMQRAYTTTHTLIYTQNYAWLNKVNNNTIRWNGLSKNWKKLKFRKTKTMGKWGGEKKVKFEWEIEGLFLLQWSNLLAGMNFHSFYLFLATVFVLLILLQGLVALNFQSFSIGWDKLISADELCNPIVRVMQSFRLEFSVVGIWTSVGFRTFLVGIWDLVHTPIVVELPISAWLLDLWGFQ